MNTINSRKDNGCFEHEAKKQDENNFYGTKTWDIAEEQFKNGLPNVAERLKKAIKLMGVKGNITANRVTRRDYYHGYAPNVSNAIIGLPKSMRQMHRTPQKVKAISIYFKPNVPWYIKHEDIAKAGETVLQMVWALERKGYRVNLSNVLISAQCGNETQLAIITLKEYTQPLDMLKLSYPVTSPSFFRRHGFRWQETAPNTKNKSWGSGYGRPMELDEVKKTLKDANIDIKNSYVIDVSTCEKHDFDALKVAQSLGITL